jgi:hypothetical protein
VKTALDETRTLILGAQILFGFQFRATFQEGFATLPRGAQALSGVALGLMLLAVGLLIAPSAQHRIAERGESTGRIRRLAGQLAELALLPFAAALGLDLSLVVGRMAGTSAGAVVGLGFAALALLGWFGVGRWMARHRGEAERRRVAQQAEAHESAPLHARIEHMLTEGRVVLPGAQALLGFQLSIVFTQAFERLPAASVLLHGLALGCVALSTILLIMPAALHRIVWAGEDTEALLRTGGWLTVGAMLPLALGIAGDAYVVFERIAGSVQVAAAAALAGLVVLLVLWFAWPFSMRAQGGVVRQAFAPAPQEALERTERR